ncbi:MAG: CoA-binding protein [Promethearchaeota archaeon]|nr:MAG: CoA-binding protein [Candidatus Lokiarchaeota archaeon]
MTETDQIDPSRNHFLYSILNPKSICTFGANNDLMATMGSMQLRNVIAGGFEGTIYPIHPTLNEVQGYKAYRSVDELPETPDLAFIILPPKVVPIVVEQCGRKGIKNMIVTSGGFREAGEQGKKLGLQLDQIVKKYGMRYIGPNCLGVFNGWFLAPKENTYFSTMWIYTNPKRGNISIASQSGTIACHEVWHANYIGAYIGKSISIGNERNIDLVDFLEFFKDDPQTEVIGLYIEEVKRGREFIKLAKEITPKKPIVAIYAGGSEAAARSIMSHTGSIGGNQKIYDTVFKETGIIATDSMTDFLYYLRTLSWAQRNKIFLKGNRIGIITDSGGAGSMMIKNCERLGLEVPEFSADLKTEIYKYIPPTASAHNPVDVTFDMNFYNLFVKFPKILMESGEVDGIIIYGVFDFGDVVDFIEKAGYLKDNTMRQFANSVDRAFMKPAKRLIQRKKIPIFYVGPQPYTFPMYKKFRDLDLPIFDFWDQPTNCMSIFAKYSVYRRNHGK